jgi:hypothetical protein
VIPKWQEGQIESDVTYGRVGFEYGHDRAQSETQQRNVVIEAYSKWNDVDKWVELEDVSEE